MTCHRIPGGLICVGTSYTDAEERARKLYRQYRCQCGLYVWDGDECKCVTDGDQSGGKRMNVLVACEFSGTVRDAFIAAGHAAVSCDLLPSETPGPHIQDDVLCALEETSGWDLLIAHPPCTHLAVSGARWFKDKKVQQAAALDFVRSLMDARVPRICIENPISIISSKIRKPDQIIQPWQFGHGETKATCLWLKGLPCLVPPNIVPGREARVHRMPPGPDRWRERSRTFQGIASAMAAQWGRATDANTSESPDSSTTDRKDDA
jgi:hypothetical protein